MYFPLLFSRVVKKHPPKITGFPSLQRPVDEIMSLLSNTNEFNFIRLSGFPGSGKTTILRNVNDHPAVEDVFDIVLWVDTSKKNNMTIDEQLIRRRKLSIDPRESNNIQLRTKLECYKFLILIDGVNEKYKELDLWDIGIPTTHIGSSVVITTNQPQRLCYNVGVRCITVPKFDDEESRYLFNSIIRCPEFVERPSIKSLITKILLRCGNNPRFIKAAAIEFRSTMTKESGEDGVCQMTIWPNYAACDAVKEAFNAFRTFLDSLPDEELLSLYYISLYTEEGMIFSHAFIQNMIADGGILEPYNTYSCDDDPGDEIMESFGRSVVNRLILRNLLDGDVEQNALSMSKFVRQLVLFNIWETRKVKTIIRTGDEFISCPDEKHWESAKWVSLESTKISMLPERPLCPLLTTLFLNKNDSLTHIPESFFENMATLHVLHLNDAKIKVLPVSITKLLSLRVLVLRNCRGLGEVPSDLGQMRSLKVVDIRGCGILVVPPQFHTLPCLRRLLCSFKCLGADVHNTATRFCLEVSKCLHLRELVVKVEEDVKEELLYQLTRVFNITKLIVLQCTNPNEPSKVEDIILGRQFHWRVKFFSEKAMLASLKNINESRNPGRQIFLGCDLSFIDEAINSDIPFYKLCGDISSETISELVAGGNANIVIENNKVISNYIALATISDSNSQSSTYSANSGRVNRKSVRTNVVHCLGNH